MSKSPALRTLHSHIDPVPFFLGVFPLAHFSTAKCEALLRNHFPPIYPP